MLYQQVVAVVLAFLLLNLLLNLRSLRRKGWSTELPEPAPLISVLVPARNEETNIEACLESLRRQDYPHYEIIVLDDDSTDRTAEMVSGIASIDPRVRLLKGQPLPPGWAGKPFACQQLAREAGGSWLLFTDADTIHAPNVLSYVLSAALGSNAALISGFPYQQTTSIWQKMALPILFYYMLFIWMPLWWLQRSERALPTVSIGQFMFFSAAAYWSIGGHEAVKSRIIEDVWLGREVARRRHRQLTLDLSQLVSCQMYREFGPMWDGIARWLYTAASLSIFALIVLMVVVVLLFLAPFLWLAQGLLLSEPAFSWQMLVGIQVSILLLGRFLVGRRFSQPKSSVILHPVGIGFIVVICLYASYQRLTGAGVKWKGRIYNHRS